MMKKVLSFVYFFICAMLLFSVSALAYIDPSAMTYIIQIIAGVAIAAGAAFGFYFRKIKRAFSKLKKNDTAQDSWDYDEDDDDDTGYDDYDIDGVVEDEPKTAKTAPVTAEAPTVSVSYESAQVSVPTDKYDERGCSDLEAENMELRRLLAKEQEKVAILKKALYICTANEK